MSGHVQVMHDDAGDVTQALAGRAEAPEAFARLYDRHAAVVLSLCRSRLIVLAEAEDAMQETFIRAFRTLAQLDDSTRLRSWLYGIARNVCSERRRADTRRRRHEATAMNLNMQQTRGVTPNGQEQSGDGDDLDRLGEALSQLDDDERLAIHLHYLQQEPAAAAMTALNMSRSGFYKLLARARDRLAALMSEAACDAPAQIERLT